MTMILRDSSETNCSQKKNSQFKRLKFSNILDEDKKFFLILNCRLFDPAYLHSLNVLLPPSSRDIDSKLENFPLEMFSPYWAPKKIYQNASASLLTFVEAISFFDGFKGGKIGSWVKLLHFNKIIPPNLQSKNEDYLREFAQCFELGEDSLIIDFGSLGIFKIDIYSTVMCNFFNFFSTFCLKKVVIRNFWIENDEFKALFFFSCGKSIFSCPFGITGKLFRRMSSIRKKIILSKFAKYCFWYVFKYIGKLGIQIGPKLVSFKSTFGHLYFDTGNGVYTGISSLPQ